MKAYLTSLVLFSVFFVCGQTENVRVYFDISESSLSEEAKVKLKAVAGTDFIESIEIVGYADSTGSKSLNTELSIQRAKSVENYLLNQGLDKTAFKNVGGRGESTSFDEFHKNRNALISYAVNAQKEKLSADEPSRSLSVEKTVEKEPKDHKALTRDGELDQSTIESLSVGEILNLGGIEFQPGRHVLTKSSYKSLKKLIDIMKNNPTMRIEIQGHICCQIDRDGLDKDTRTMNLSENRAITIYNELIKSGVSKDRLTYNGYGPFRKIADEINDEARQRNRRVSIQILSK
jgi:outer membrane protein OmpA-like peptidoglycan-associated protein